MSEAPPAPKIAPWSTYGRLWPGLKPYAPRLALVLLARLVATALNLAQPLISKLMIDEALIKRDWDMLVKIAALMVGATVGGFAVNALVSYRYVAISAAMLFDMRVALLRHLQTLSPRFYGSFRLGDLMSRLNSDVSDVQRVVGDTLLSVVSNVLFFAGSVGMMLWLDWKLFLVGTVLVPLAVASFLHFQRRMTDLSRQMRESGADIGSLLVDTIMGMRTVNTLGAEEHQAERFRAANGGFIATMLKMRNDCHGIKRGGDDLWRQADYRWHDDHRRSGGLHHLSRTLAGAGAGADGPDIGPCDGAGGLGADIRTV